MRKTRHLGMLWLSVCAMLASGPMHASTDPTQLSLSGNRFKAPAYAQMPEPQQKLVQAVLDSEWTATSPPLNVLLNSPEAGLILREIGVQLRHHSGLTDAQRDIAILMTMRAWTAQRAWAEYKPGALRSGLSPATIAALAKRKTPASLAPEEQAVWRLANELLNHRMISDKTFADARRLLGDEQLVNLTMLAPYYELLCMLEQLDDAQVPTGQRSELKSIPMKIEPLPADALGPVPSFPAMQEAEGPSTGQFKVVGGRYAPLKWSEMNDDQKRLADRLLNSWRRSVSSIFIAMMRSPRLGLVYENLGSLLSPRTAPMDLRIRNFATLMVSRHWHAQFEYWAAHRNAVASGMSEDQVAAVTAGQRPPNADAKLTAAYELCKELLNERRVSDATYRQAMEHLGARDTVGTVIMIGFYGMVAAQTEALLRYPMPDGIPAELLESSH